MYARNASEAMYPNLWRGLVGAWSPAMNPRGGTTLLDWSGYGRHGTLTTMDPATDWVISNGYQSLDYDGSDDEVVTSGFPFLSGPITISAWIWHNQPYTSVVYMSVVSRGSVFEDNTNFAFGVRTNSGWQDYGLFCYWRSGATLYGNEFGTGDGGITTGVWHHVAAVINASYDLTLYLDMVVKKTDSANAVSGNGSQQLQIGTPNTVAGNDVRWTGRLADVMIYDRALNETTLRQIYNLGIGGWAKRRQWSVPISEQAVVAAGGPVLSGRVVQDGRIFGGSVLI